MEYFIYILCRETTKVAETCKTNGNLCKGVHGLDKLFVQHNVMNYLDSLGHYHHLVLVQSSLHCFTILAGFAFIYRSFLSGVTLPQTHLTAALEHLSLAQQRRY